MVLTTGMDFYFSWKVAKSENKIHDLKEYIGHKLHLTIFLSVFAIISAWVILPTDVAIMLTILFVPIFLNSNTAFLQYSFATNRAKLVASTQAITAATLLIFKVILVITKASLISFVVINAIDTVLMVTILAFIYLRNKEMKQEMKLTNFPSIGNTISFLYSIRMSLIAIALWQLILRIDQLVLATISNAYALGIYAAAVKISEVPNFFAGILYTTLLSHIAVTASKSDEYSKRSIKKVMLIYLISGSLISLIIVILAPFIVGLLYGSKFIDVIPVLRMYALSIPGMFLTLHFVAMYGVREKYKQQSFIFLLGLMVNILLVYILTPVFGLVGTAFATVVAYSLLSIVLYYHVR